MRSNNHSVIATTYTARIRLLQFSSHIASLVGEAPHLTAPTDSTNPSHRAILTLGVTAIAYRSQVPHPDQVFDHLLEQFLPYAHGASKVCVAMSATISQDLQ